MPRLDCSLGLGLFSMNVFLVGLICFINDNQPIFFAELIRLIANLMVVSSVRLVALSRLHADVVEDWDKISVDGRDKDKLIRAFKDSSAKF